MRDRNGVVDRVALALPEARLDHGLSLRQLERLSGVGRHHIRKVERGEPIDPALLVRLGATLMVLDAHRPPSFEEDVAALAQPPRATLAQPSRATLPQLLPDGRWAA